MRPRRSELELFRALPDDASGADLAELSDRLRRCVHWVLGRMTSGSSLRGDAEDIVDEARLRLEQLRHRGFHGGDREFRSYLYKVVVSACVEARDRRRWTASLDAPVTLPDGEEKPLGEMVEAMVDPALSIDARLERTEEASFARRALERVDERCRTLLQQFHVDNVPIRQLAEERGARVNTIEVALTRCRSRLYAAFLSLYVDAGDPSWRERVTRAADRLSGHLQRIFTAWWSDNRSVAEISKEVGLPPLDTKRLLGMAKFQVWRLLSESTP